MTDRRKNGLLGAATAVFRDRLIRNMGWFCLAEGGARIFKLATTVVLARLLGPVELGIAAIAITVYELVRVIANNGIGQMVIRALPDDLDATCNTAARANWLMCGLAGLLHVAVGAAVARLTGRQELGMMIACMGAIYPLMIPSLLPVYLLLRKGAIKQIALANMATVMADNALTISFAIAGFGAWSIVLPKLLVVPIWIFGIRASQTWTRNRAAGGIGLLRMARFALPVIASEMLGAMRSNLDNILVWSILGVEALGIYYFAFNAGIGFSLSLTGALRNSLYPELARLAARRGRMLRCFDRAMLRSALPIAAVIGLQAAMTFIYVPVVFGPRWAPHVLLVALLCASAITRPFFESASQLLRAAGQPLDEVVASSAYTVVTLGLFGLALVIGQGLLAGVLTLALCAFLLQAAFAVWARRRVAVRLKAARKERGFAIVMATGVAA